MYKRKAVAYACHPDAWGVQIVFDNQVILGTRARKTRTKSFNAFSSIDYPETAMFRDRRLIQFLQRPADYTHAVFSLSLLHLLAGKENPHRGANAAKQGEQ